MKKNIRPIFLIFILAALIPACQSGTSRRISITEAWGRAAPAETMTSAFYLKISNSGDADRLIAVQNANCGSTELHESMMDANGVMSMKPIPDGIEIPANGTIELKPGGIHIMCMEKKGSFEAGSKQSIELKFEKAGAITVQAEIRQP